MYSVTGQTEDQQVSQQHSPPRVLIFEIGSTDYKCQKIRTLFAQ